MLYGFPLVFPYSVCHQMITQRQPKGPRGLSEVAQRDLCGGYLNHMCNSVPTCFQTRGGGSRIPLFCTISGRQWHCQMHSVRVPAQGNHRRSSRHPVPIGVTKWDTRQDSAAEVQMRSALSTCGTCKPLCT